MTFTEWLATQVDTERDDEVPMLAAWAAADPDWPDSDDPAVLRDYIGRGMAAFAQGYAEWATSTDSS